jgi:hypothetical protein
MIRPFDWVLALGCAAILAGGYCGRANRKYVFFVGQPGEKNLSNKFIKK